MTPTEKEVIKIAEEQVLDFYEKYNVPFSERKKFNPTFNVTHETATKGISNNIPELVKAMEEERTSELKKIAFYYFLFFIVATMFALILS